MQVFMRASVAMLKENENEHEHEHEGDKDESKDEDMSEVVYLKAVSN